MEVVEKEFCVEEASSLNLDGVAQYRHLVLSQDVYAEQARLEHAWQYSLASWHEEDLPHVPSKSLAVSLAYCKKIVSSKYSTVVKECQDT